MLDRGYRPLPDQKYPDRNPPRAARSRGLCAEWFRRRRAPDRAAQSECELFRRELRREGRALEEAVAGAHDAHGRYRNVGWAKALSRRAHHPDACATVVGTLRFA